MGRGPVRGRPARLQEAGLRDAVRRSERLVRRVRAVLDGPPVLRRRAAALSRRRGAEAPRVSERRRTLRRGLHLPVVVKGHGREGPWEETTSTTDVCHGGVGLALRRIVPIGQVLHLSLPLPEMFRRYDSTTVSYKVWALVRNCDPQGPPYRTGAMFLGKHPPRGFEQNPAGLYFLPSDPQ